MIGKTVCHYRITEKLGSTAQGQALNHVHMMPGLTYADLRIDHPNRNAMINQFFNTAAIIPVASVPRGSFGNMGRNVIDGPTSSSTDIALLRELVMREALRAQLWGELFNAFNQVNFANPTNSATSSSFGRTLSTSHSGRVIQLALKLVW